MRLLVVVAAAAVAAAAADADADAEGTRAMLGRLQGHRAHVAGDRLVIEDIAGEGAPLVGVIERRGDGLWIAGDGFAYRLEGPLARPRIAGPGYRVWVIGEVVDGKLRARRLGVLQRGANTREKAAGSTTS